jgi:hypothetical protein
MPQMHPRVRMRWGHPQELSLHRLDGMLLHVGQDDAPLVGCRWERTGVIRTVAAARAGLPSNGAVLQIRHQCVLDMGQRVAPAMSVPAELSATSPTAVRDVYAQAHRHADVQESDDVPRRRRQADQHG